MTALYLLEPDPPGAEWAPFGGVRPIAELRAGIWRIRERWEAAVQADTSAILARHVEGFRGEDEGPPVRPPGTIEGPAVIAAAWFAPAGAAQSLPPEARRLAHRGTTVGWKVGPGERWSGPSSAGTAVEVEGCLLGGSYDLITALEQFLAADCEDFRPAPSRGVPEGSIVLGDPARVLSLGAAIEPGVVFDVRPGAVVLEEGAEVRSGTRLEGPVYVGAGTRVLGGCIRNSVLGPECRVRGEVTSSVFLAYANKAHDGFVGHSVVGPWVNLGAGTTTSNLKNTYGPVRLEVAGKRIETGRTNLGTLFGDHAKTAIGTMLATGSVVSAGAQIFGASIPPKYLPPFAWGCDGERLDEAGFLRTAERVMSRRNLDLTPARREALRKTFARGMTR